VRAGTGELITEAAIGTRPLKSHGNQGGFSSEVESTIKGTSDSIRTDEAEK
jgi:hypothetical protein